MRRLVLPTFKLDLGSPHHHNALCLIFSDSVIYAIILQFMIKQILRLPLVHHLHDEAWF